jgi:hypothetical protein
MCLSTMKIKLLSCIPSKRKLLIHYGQYIINRSASCSRYKELNLISLPLDILQNDDKVYELYFELYEIKETYSMLTCENGLDNFCNYVFSCTYHL